MPRPAVYIPSAPSPRARQFQLCYLVIACLLFDDELEMHLKIADWMREISEGD